MPDDDATADPVGTWPTAQDRPAPADRAPDDISTDDVSTDDISTADVSTADVSTADVSTDDGTGRALPARARPILPLAVLGVVLGLVLGLLGLAVTGGLTAFPGSGSGAGSDTGAGTDGGLGAASSGPPPSPRAAADLVAALRRSRTATFASVEIYRRIGPNGVDLLATRTTRVQRPPDSLVRTDTVIDRVRDGRHTACGAEAASPAGFRCRSEPAAPVNLAAATADDAALLTGRAPLYAVARRDDGCFALTARVERTAPPYGRRAVLCFDPITGAPTRSEIVKASGTGFEVTDETVVETVRAVVGDGDLALPDGIDPG